MPWLLAFLIGAVSGLRSLTAPAVIAWAVHQHWIEPPDSSLAFVGSTGAVIVFSLLALAELAFDKLPSAPARTKPVGLLARIVLGGLCGATLTSSASLSVATGSLLGAAGGLAGAFAGYEARTRLTRPNRFPAFVVALLEDAVALGGGLLIVSLF